MTQVDKGVYIPLIIAAGGGGRGYSSQSQTQLEQMDYDPNQLGRNGKSHAAGTLYTALMCVCAGTICMCVQLIISDIICVSVSERA